MLALWSYFWTETDWVTAPPLPPAPSLPGPPTDSGAGSGGKSNAAKQAADDYFENKAPEVWWDTREAYLRSLFEKTKPPAAKPVTKAANDEPPPAPLPAKHNFFPQYTNDIAEAVSAVRLAENAEQLRRAGKRLVEVNNAYTAEQQRLQTEAASKTAARTARQAARASKKKAAAIAAKLLLRSIGKLY